MLIIWKNKGLLVILYLIVSLLGVAIITSVLDRNFGGVFSKIDFYTIAGIAFLISAIWIYLTKDDYYKDRDGNKKKMEFANEFFFIKMEIWAYIFFAAALVFLGYSLFNYFSK